MGLATSQQLQNYYDLYRDREITFTKDILKTLNVDPRQIYIKCSGNQWPCIINSTSLMLAKIIVGSKGGAYQQLTKKDATGPVSLRFCFTDSDKQLVSFFVNGRVTEVSPYMNSSELAVITITFNQRPPDDLIEKVGTLLDANANAVRRKEERIVLNPEVKRKMGLHKEETIVQVQGVPRRCILRDISFSGAKIILMGISKFIQNKETILQIRFDEPTEIVAIRGMIVLTAQIEGRQDLIVASIKFDETTVPLNYKIRINNYLTNLRKTMLSIDNEEAAKRAAVKAAVQKAAKEAKEGAAEDQTTEAAPSEAPAQETASSQEPAAETPAQSDGAEEAPAAEAVPEAGTEPAPEN